MDHRLGPRKMEPWVNPKNCLSKSSQDVTWFSLPMMWPSRWAAVRTVFRLAFFGLHPASHDFPTTLFVQWLYIRLLFSLYHTFMIIDILYIYIYVYTSSLDEFGFLLLTSHDPRKAGSFGVREDQFFQKARASWALGWPGENDARGVPARHGGTPNSWMGFC